MIFKKIHQEIALINRLSPAAIHLWQWLLRKSRERDLITPDIREFNEFIEKKRGKAYCPKTLKIALASLADSGIVKLGRRFAWYCHDLILAPIEELTRAIEGDSGEGKKVPESEKTSPSENVESSVDGTSADPGFIQQQRERNTRAREIADLLDRHGIAFSARGIRRLACWPVERVKDALRLFYLHGGKEKIYSPAGYIYDSLRFYWLENFDYDEWVRCIRLKFASPVSPGESTDRARADLERIADLFEF